jgi:Predicted Zn-dependent protease (DUF2268)
MAAAADTPGAFAPSRRTRCRTGAAALACLAAAQWCAAAAPARTTPDIHIEDVERFYRVYDAAGGQPTAEQLQRDYLDPGSDGLHEFAKERNITGVRIAEAISKRPEIYQKAKSCMIVLPRVRQRLQTALGKLMVLYPQAIPAPVTIAVGRGKPVGVANASGVRIGLEALCDADLLNPNLEDRFVHVIAHEYGHVQQLQSLGNDEQPTVLEESLVEGGAELVAEVISGQVSYSHMGPLTRGREKEIETAFSAAMDETDLSKWLYNGKGTPEWPGDLGYWVGYRICKTYYDHAADKRTAFREVLEISDPHVFLLHSGWYPGIELK